jgi:hypothetical protein
MKLACIWCYICCEMNLHEKILEGWDARPSVGVRQEEGVSLRWDQLRYVRQLHAAPSEPIQSLVNRPQPMPTAYPWEKPKSRRSDPSVDDTKAFQKGFSLAVCLIAIPMLFAVCGALWCPPVFRSRYSAVVVASDSAVYFGVLPWTRLFFLTRRFP